jgi:hypothetical protein
MRWVYPQFLNPLGYTNLIALLILDLIIYVVHVVLLNILINIVPESARLSTILIGQCTLQELISIGKLLPLQLISEIRCQTYKS